jgi:hypothetical protein
LAKYYWGWLPLFLHLPIDDNLAALKKNLKITEKKALHKNTDWVKFVCLKIICANLTPNAYILFPIGKHNQVLYWLKQSNLLLQHQLVCI